LWKTDKTVAKTLTCDSNYAQNNALLIFQDK